MRLIIPFIAVAVACQAQTVTEHQYFDTLDKGITGMRAAYAPSNVIFGCHLILLVAGFFDQPTFQNEGMLKDAALNLKTAGCKHIIGNLSYHPWTGPDPALQKLLASVFGYVTGELGLQLEFSPQVTPLVLADCEATGKWGKTIDHPGEWAECAMPAIQGMASFKPFRIGVAHETSHADDIIRARYPKWASTPAAWKDAINQWHGAVKAISPATRTSVGCHQGETAECGVYDGAAVDDIYLDYYVYGALGAAENILRAASKAGKGIYIGETSPTAWTADEKHSEEKAIHGTGYARRNDLNKRWVDATVARFRPLGITAMHYFWTQAFRYYAADGAEDNGLSGQYNLAVAGAPAQALTPFGEFVRDYPFLH